MENGPSRTATVRSLRKLPTVRNPKSGGRVKLSRGRLARLEAPIEHEAHQASQVRRLMVRPGIADWLTEKLAEDASIIRIDQNSRGRRCCTRIWPPSAPQRPLMSSGPKMLPG